MRTVKQTAAALLTLVCCCVFSPPPAHASTIVPERCLVLAPVRSAGRSATFVDPLEARIVAGKFRAPKAGDTLPAREGSALVWRAMTAKEPGHFESDALEHGAYLFFEIDSSEQRVMMLDAQGHSMVYVNGEPRAGDPYASGYVQLPILLRKGSNALLFHVGRGSLRLKLTDPPAELFFSQSDLTLPDAIRGVPSTQPAGAVLVNGSDSPRRIESLGLTIPPLSVRKVTLPTRYDGDPSARESKQHWTVDGAELDATLRVREPSQTYKRTFISDIDGSVQYYAIDPASGPHAPQHPALVLSLHGAAVEATNQADAYGPHDWASIVCPTNRRPYGFDWEDTGRLDALEVLDDAKRELKTDPGKTYLTGHSMGGHGAWQLGVTFPDHWAAVGPSAGWISFSTYAGGATRPTTSPTSQVDQAMQDLLHRCTSPSDTLALIHNLAPLPIYILHGTDDDNVPIQQARRMAQELARFHDDFQFYAQPGAGHWWDVSPAPGADCVDWPPMFQMFQQHRLPDAKDVRHVDFTTMSPSVSASCFWATIGAQQHALRPSSVHLKCGPDKRIFTGTTSNVARLMLQPAPLKGTGPIELEIDDQKLRLDQPMPSQVIWLDRDGSNWRVSGPPLPELKSAQRCGPFKDLFRNRVQFVYGTKGDPQENAWALAKARFDAETFWVRGNGSIDVLADVDFDPAKEPERNVVLYGNADTNAAWNTLLGDSPVQVRRGRAILGNHEELGDDLAVLFLRPRSGSQRACVGAVAGSGIIGMRLTNRLPYFVSGVAYPDCIVIGPEMLQQRGAAGVRAAGFFGNDWSITSGEFIFR